MSNRLVSLIVPVCDGLRDTRRMVESYQAHTSYEPRELIFVDNGSGQPTRRYLEGLRKKDIVDSIVRLPKNEGFPAGVNQGLAHADGDYIGILNNDIWLTHGWLEKMVRVLEENPTVGIVSPLRVGMGNEHPHILDWQMNSVPNYPDHRFTAETDLKILRQKMDKFVNEIEARCDGVFNINHTMLPFFCTLIRREVFNDVGLLDEDFGVGLVEDTYFCRLATQKGWELASCLDNYVHHFISQTLKRVVGEEEMAVQQAANYKLMNRKLAEAK